jgi:hypothetical protein
MDKENIINRSCICLCSKDRKFIVCKGSKGRRICLVSENCSPAFYNSKESATEDIKYLAVSAKAEAETIKTVDPKLGLSKFELHEYLRDKMEPVKIRETITEEG